jgi:pentatricopeptide repeat protein
MVSKTIDDSFQAFYVRSFAPPYRTEYDWKRTNLGIALLQLQLRSNVLVSPYDTVPKRVIVQALQAVTSFQGQQQRRQIPSFEPNILRKQNDLDDDDDDNNNNQGVCPDIAFRLLQRLVTGVGVRNQLKNDIQSTKQKQQQQQVPAALYEVDFNRVINVYSNLGNMDMAHRVIALQERTKHAPSLSPVTYSILVKGYGKLGDWNNIDILLRHAAASEITPDTILFNSLMDAYINCNQLDKALQVFDAMVNHKSTVSKQNDEDDDFPFAPDSCPPPNIRSYNTLLKGLAQKCRWDDARELSIEMKDGLGLWDHVTTNTLVQAAVAANDFDSAETILEENSLTPKNDGHKTNYHHPNADAYTSLIDGYAKNRQLDKALALFQTMKNRHVEPNEFHYSSLIGGLARHRKVEQAYKLLSRVKTTGISTTRQRAIYNAFISGLVNEDGIHDNHDQHIDQALSIVRDMISERIFPNVNTVAIILDGFGKCLSPRVVEATTLVEKLEGQRIIPRNHKMIYTALVRVHASANDLKGAVTCFRKISQPDTPAINALIDAAVRCGYDQAAMDAFHRYFRNDGNRQPREALPDVISYSTLIGAFLKKGTLDGARAARELYEEMRFRRRMFPDKVLVDM